MCKPKGALAAWDRFGNEAGRSRREIRAAALFAAALLRLRPVLSRRFPAYEARALRGEQSSPEIISFSSFRTKRTRRARRSQCARRSVAAVPPRQPGHDDALLAHHRPSRRASLDGTRVAGWAHFASGPNDLEVVVRSITLFCRSQMFLMFSRCSSGEVRRHRRPMILISS